MPRGIYKRKRATTTRHLVGHAPKAHAAEAAPAAPPALAIEVSQKTQRLMDTVRPAFMALVENLTLVNQSRAELAKPFNDAYEAWAAETNGQFVVFVRGLDPTVPLDREDYRNYPAYTTAQNLRRLATASGKKKAKSKAVTPLVALARFLATVLPLFGDVDEQATIWVAFVKQMHWTEQQVARLQTIVNREGPISLGTPANASHRKSTPATPILRAPLTLTRRTGTAG